MDKPPVDPPIFPQQLRQIVATLSAGVVLIDLKRSIFWSNNAALAMHDVHELAGLGGTAAGYRKKYRLKYLNNRPLQPRQYPLDRLAAGEEFTAVEVDIHKLRDKDFRAVHRLQGLALRDDAGNAQAWALIMEDITDDVCAEERFEKTFNVNPAPALICCLSDLRYIKVNRGFLAMTGYRARQVIGQSTNNLNVLANAADPQQAEACLTQGVALPQMEATFKLPNGTDKFVIVAGQPIEVAGEHCMLFTFIDLDARKKTEDALRHSEERFSTAFRLAPAPMMVSSLMDMTVKEINDAFVAATGYTAQELAGRDTAALALWADRQHYGTLKALLKQTGRLQDYEIQLRTKEGALLDCLASAETVTIDEQPCMLCVIQDITQRKRSEVELIQAIDAVMRDATWFGRTVIEKLAQIRQPRNTAQALKELADLTPREYQVLGLMCQGLEDDPIAKELKISRNTVRNHVATIYNKIGVHRRGAAIVWARERGLVRYEKPGRLKPGGTR